MKLKSIFLLVTLFFACGAYAQNLNLSFENQNLLNPWYLIGKPDKYTIKTDTEVFYDGKQSLVIQNNQPSDSFGGVMLSLPHNLKGDTIEFSAMIKLEDVDEKSKLGFMLRIDPGIYFDNAEEYNFRGTSDWSEYKLKAKLRPQTTTGIYIAVFLSGQGKILADNMKIRVDGKDITLFQDMFIPFAKEQPPVTTSGIMDFKTSATINSRLADLAKIWGILKYRHPEIAKGDIDWDQQLFKSMQQIIAAKDDWEIEKHYRELLDSLGEIVAVPPPAHGELKQPADYSWVDKLPFNNTLKEELRKLKYSSFDRHCYFAFQPGVGNVEITNEIDYPHLENPDVGFRLLSLFRYWNIVQYFSPYRYLTDEPWEKVLENYIPKMIASRGALAYQMNVSAMLGEMKDAHTKLWSRPKALSEFMGNRTLPAAFKLVEGKPIITRLPSTADIGTSLKVGDVILRKNGKTIAEIQDSLYHLIATPNPAVIAREMAYKVAQTKEEKVWLDIERDGKVIRVEVPSIPMNELKIPQDTVPVEILDGGIAYINHGYLTKAIVEQYAEEAADLKGLVIDIRNYPRDFLVFVLTPLLLPQAEEFVKFTKTSYDALGDFVFKPSLKVGEYNPHYYKGKIAILIDEDTQSSAEYHTMAYRIAPKAKVFGSQTAGADGNISGFTLPGGLYSTISGIGVYYPDGGETQRIGIVPDVEVKPTIKGIRAGRDEVLEKALEYLNAD